MCALACIGVEGSYKAICQDVSLPEALWQRFFDAVAVGKGKGGKWAYIEWAVIIKWLQRGVLARGVKKVSGRHGMPTNGTKIEVES